MDSSWTEPKSDYAAVYPYNNVTQTESGHFMEMDDTPGAERIRLQHRTGTFTEVQADGKRINKVLGKNYEIIMDDNNVYIKGMCNITVEGNSVINVKGDMYAKIEGNCNQEIKGDSIQAVHGNAEIHSDGDMDINASGTVTLGATSVDINSDVNVRGTISSSQSITAVKNITAGLQSYANLGFVTPGWISAGSPVALMPVPGYISGLMVKDIVRSMVEDRIIYDVHIHPTPKGPTGPPIPLM